MGNAEYMGILNMLSEFKNEQNRKNIYTTKNLNKYLVTKHSWHLVDPSPWPLVTALGAFTITFSLVLIMHSYKYGDQLIICGFLILLYSIYMWWRDIIRDATLEEQHTFSVQRSLRLGMLLFIVSEIMFFFCFFLGFLSFKSVTNVQHWCNLATRSYRNNFKFGYTIDEYFFSLKLRYNCNLGSSCDNKPCKKTCNYCIVVDTNSCNFIYWITSF